jgi:hypothetical protein
LILFNAFFYYFKILMTIFQQRFKKPYYFAIYI